jgi:hypothetical protein
MGYYNEQSYNRSQWGKKNHFSNKHDFEIQITGESVVSKYMRGRDIEALEEFNAKIQQWGTKVKESLVSSIQSLVTKDDHLSKSLKNNYRTGKGSDEIERIGFSFRPEGVYVHLGVGRGYHRMSGNTVRTAKTNTFKERQPILWFNPVVEQHVEELSKIVEEYSEDLIINYSRIFINS